VPGYFGEFEGVASVSGENVTTLKGKIKTASVNTENTKRDDHLRNEDYFDAPKYPEITFNSTASAAGTITGDLTIHGVTKSVTLKISRDRDAFVLEGQIDRTHFGVGKGLGTSVQIADEVNIKLWFRPQV
jgi:polyisoprenoid-binding protein YceI